MSTSQSHHYNNISIRLIHPSTVFIWEKMLLFLGTLQQEGSAQIQLSNMHRVGFLERTILNQKMELPYIFQYSIQLLQIYHIRAQPTVNPSKWRDPIIYTYPILPMLGITLGQGSFSQVHLQMHSNKVYACKKINLMSSYSLQYLINEINSLRSLHHPNLVKCYGINMASFKYFDIYLEYIKGKTLDQAYNQAPTEQLLFYWIYQIAKALAYLASLNLVHRDLKPKNIMVSDAGLVKIVDFGVSRFVSSSRVSIVGSPSYLAPEVIANKRLTTQSDIWSVGVTIYELIHQSFPYQVSESISIYHCICRSDIDEQPFICSQDMRGLLKRMLCKDPNNRITAQGILSHPAIRSREGEWLEHYNELVNDESSD